LACTEDGNNNLPDISVNVDTDIDIFLTAIGLIAGGSSAVHIYTEIHRRTQWNRIHGT
jgi:hypothetical protein